MLTIVSYDTQGEITGVMRIDEPGLESLYPNGIPASGVLVLGEQDVRPGWYYVNDGVLAEYTPQEQADKAERPAHWLTWSNTTMSWVDLRTLAEVKTAKRQELAAAWNAERTAGVTLGGKTAPTDADSWTRYLALKAMAEDAGTWINVPIPLVDGTFELLTLAKAQALWGALKSLERTLLVKLRDKIDAVQAAATVAEIEAITWGVELP